MIDGVDTRVQAHAIAVEESAVPAVAGYTFPQLLQRNRELYGHRKIALRKKRYGLWNGFSWEDYYQHVEHLSLGLLSLGLRRRDKVAILGDNDPEWWFAALATQAAGGVVVGIHPDCAASEVKYFVEDSDAVYVFAKDQEQVDKILLIGQELPQVRAIIYWNPKGVNHYDDSSLMDFLKIQQMGAEHAKREPTLFKGLVGSGKPEDNAVICYTAGTSGTPTAMVHTYLSILSNTAAILDLHGWLPSDEYVSLLSPAWSAEHILGFGAALATGTAVNFPEQPETSRDNMREVSPQFLALNSRALEEVYREVHAKIGDAWPIAKLLYGLCLRLGKRTASFHYANLPPPVWWRILFRIADFVVLQPIRDRIGLSRARSCLVGGSTLNPEVCEYLRAIGVPVFAWYMLTEAGVVSVEAPGASRKGSVGKLVGSRTMKIGERAEILVERDRLCPAENEKPATVADVSRKCWYHTGDSGYFDRDGFLHLTGRIADIQTLVNGQRFSPDSVETVLRSSLYIKDAAVLGDGKEFAAALVSIDLTSVGRWAEQHRVSYTTFVDLCQRLEVYDLIASEIQRLNHGLPLQCCIRRFVNLPKQIGAERALHTRTGKLRRELLRERYREYVRALYDANTEELKVDAEVRYRDGRVEVVSTSVRIASVGNRPA